MNGWHGTVGGYTNHRCRCTDCRQAMAVYHAEHWINTRHATPPTPRPRPLPPADPDMEWLTDAACSDEHPATFVPTGYGWSPDAALAVCEGCPVRVPCGRYGTATGSVGVWGGRYIGRWNGREVA